MSDVTRILRSIEQGDPKAPEQLLPLVYEELRKLAAARMTQEPPGQTLQATALVHEAWLKLAGSDRQQWRGREHFFGAAAEAMRRILIDKARRKASQKRGGNQPPEELHESRIELQAPSDEILAVHEALDELAAEDRMAAEVVAAGVQFCNPVDEPREIICEALDEKKMPSLPATGGLRAEPPASM